MLLQNSAEDITFIGPFVAAARSGRFQITRSIIKRQCSLREILFESIFVWGLLSVRVVTQLGYDLGLPGTKNGVL